MMRRVALTAILAMPTAAAGQTAPPASGAVAVAPIETGLATPFVYEVDGRRDPFVDLLATAPEPVQRGTGVAGLSLSEVSLRGVLQSNGSLIAMIQGPDKRTYTVRAGDKLADGVVKSVTPEGLIVLQDIPGPLSHHTQQEVKKLLRPAEGTKE